MSYSPDMYGWDMGAAVEGGLLGGIDADELRTMLDGIVEQITSVGPIVNADTLPACADDRAARESGWDFSTVTLPDGTVMARFWDSASDEVRARAESYLWEPTGHFIDYDQRNGEQ